MSKHLDKLGSLLAQLKSNFSFISISKTRSLVDDDDDSVPVALEQKQDFPIPGYKKFFTPTESSAGGVSLCVSKCLSYTPRNDLKQSFYLAHNLEAAFVEIIQPKKANMIVGTIYQHPGMPITLFNSDYLKPLLHKITSEKKQILLLGDFNINLLKCDNEPDLIIIINFCHSISDHLPQFCLFPSLNSNEIEKNGPFCCQD